MKGRFALMRRPQFIRAVVSSLVLSLGCLAGGCGAGSGSGAPSGEMPVAGKNLQEHMKKRAAMQKGAQGKGQRSGPTGR
jgi:hypothetical protein